MKHIQAVSILCFVAAACCLLNIAVLGFDAYFRNYYAKHPEENPLLQGPNGADALKASRGFMYLELLFVPLSLAGCAVNGLAGYQVRRGEGKPLFIAAAVMNLVPCVFGCCLVGPPVGIYMLVVLANPQIQALFSTTDARQRMRMIRGEVGDSNDEQPR